MPASFSDRLSELDPPLEDAFQQLIAIISQIKTGLSFFVVFICRTILSKLEPYFQKLANFIITKAKTDNVKLRDIKIKGDRKKNNGEMDSDTTDSDSDFIDVIPII